MNDGQTEYLSVLPPFLQSDRFLYSMNQQLKYSERQQRIRSNTKWFEVENRLRSQSLRILTSN